MRFGTYQWRALIDVDRVCFVTVLKCNRIRYMRWIMHLPVVCAMRPRCFWHRGQTPLGPWTGHAFGINSVTVRVGIFGHSCCSHATEQLSACLVLTHLVSCVSLAPNVVPTDCFPFRVSCFVSGTLLLLSCHRAIASLFSDNPPVSVLPRYPQWCLSACLWPLCNSERTLSQRVCVCASRLDWIASKTSQHTCL